MCVSTVWSVRLLGVWALNFFRWLGCWPLPGLGLGAAPLCSLCTSRPGGCLRLWCSCYLRRMLAGLCLCLLFWLAVFCRGIGAPAFGLACAAVPPGCLMYKRREVSSLRPAGGCVVGLALAVLLLLALSPMRQAVGLLAPVAWRGCSRSVPGSLWAK